MTNTIPHPTPPLEDVRVVVARRALAELPAAEDIERPYFWIGRTRTNLQALVDGWPSGVPGGLSEEHREVLGAALADAISYRTPEGFCADCEAHPANLCLDCAADLDLTDAHQPGAAVTECDPARLRGGTAAAGLVQLRGCAGAH
jgi:hypothetical protein